MPIEPRDLLRYLCSEGLAAKRTLTSGDSVGLGEDPPHGAEARASPRKVPSISEVMVVIAVMKRLFRPRRHGCGGGLVGRAICCGAATHLRNVSLCRSAWIAALNFSSPHNPQSLGYLSDAVSCWTSFPIHCLLVLFCNFSLTCPGSGISWASLSSHSLAGLAVGCSPQHSFL